MPDRVRPCAQAWKWWKIGAVRLLHELAEGFASEPQLTPEAKERLLHVAAHDLEHARLPGAALATAEATRIAASSFGPLGQFVPRPSASSSNDA